MGFYSNFPTDAPLGMSMKFIRQGLVIIACIYLTLTIMAGCAHFHQITFLNEACIKPHHRYDYLTCEKMGVEIDGKRIVIPKNFKTDLASIPRMFWPFLAPQYSGFVAPAILHDYLYRCSNTSRVYADEALYSALITEDVTAFTASKFFVAVRLFGRSHFKRHHGECK